MEIKVSYEAKTVEEVLELLKAVESYSDTKAVFELKDVTEAEAEEEAEKTEEATEESKEEIEEVEETEEEAKPKAKRKTKAKKYTVEDLQALAIEANKAGKLSKIKAILAEHEIDKISHTPEDLIEVVGQEFSGVLA